MIWEFLFDLGDSQLVFRPEIAVTTPRPDIVIFSRSKKAVLLVPLEDRVAAGHTRKKNRFAGFVQQCTENGWFARRFAVEVGCLGYFSPSLNPLGYQALFPANFEMNVVVVAHRCSYVLFLRRSCVDWNSWSMGWPFHLLKARLGSPHCSYLAARFSPSMSFPFSPKLALPCPLPQQCLLCVHFSVSSFGSSRPPQWALIHYASIIFSIICLKKHNPKGKA